MEIIIIIIKQLWVCLWIAGVKDWFLPSHPISLPPCLFCFSATASFILSALQYWYELSLVQLFMRPLPGIFPLAQALQWNSSLVKSNPEQPDFLLYNSLAELKTEFLSTDMIKMNGMFSAYIHAWMFYSLFALYFLLSLVFFSCSFTPSLLELQPKTLFP